MYMGYVIRKKRHIQATGNQKYRVIDEKPGGSEKVKAKGTSVKKAIYQRAMLTTLSQESDIIKTKKDDKVLQYLDDLQKSNYQDRKPNTRNKDDIDEIEGEDIYIPKDKGGDERMKEVVKKAKELVKAIEGDKPQDVIEDKVEEVKEAIEEAPDMGDSSGSGQKQEEKKEEEKPPALTKTEEQRLKKLSSFARFRKLSAKENAEFDDLHKRSKKA